MTAEIMQGDCLEVMPTLDADSVDAIVCDPPYGLSFMGKNWDSGVPGVAFWTEALRVTKPGAYLLAFGGTRTFHRLTVAIEDAGWEIQDCLCWLYGSGFPKHKSKLKPAWEPIIMARKPAPKATHLNIDACRIEGVVPQVTQGVSTSRSSWDIRTELTISNPHPSGRWPANVIMDEEAAAALDAMSGIQKSGVASPNGGVTGMFSFGKRDYATGYGDTGGASRFFYCAKSPRSEREAGLDGMPVVAVRGNTVSGDGQGEYRTMGRASTIASTPLPKARNHHPTVKPLAVMRWLCRLVTPPNGLVLDPFCGSGTTGCAAVQEGFRFIGIEKEPEYAEIARARIEHWTPEPDLLTGAA